MRNIDVRIHVKLEVKVPIEIFFEFFWSNLFKIEVMITPLIEMLELLNFGHMKLCIKMQPISVFLNIAKCSGFR